MGQLCAEPRDHVSDGTSQHPSAQDRAGHMFPKIDSRVANTHREEEEGPPKPAGYAVQRDEDHRSDVRGMVGRKAVETTASFGDACPRKLMKGPNQFKVGLKD